MRRLVPCPDCKRHVRATDTTCPHCGRSSGALGFAALAMTAGLALAGCDRPPVAAVYGPPAPDPTARVEVPIEPATTSSAVAAPNDNPTAAATTTSAPTAAPKPTSPARPDPVNVPMYGPAPRSPELRVPDKK